MQTHREAGDRLLGLLLALGIALGVLLGPSLASTAAAVDRDGYAYNVAGHAISATHSDPPEAGGLRVFARAGPRESALQQRLAVDLVAPRQAVPCNSFVPGIAVLMADGTTKPIEDVELGDLVWAADPETGEEGPREVTRLIAGHGDKTLVDIEIDGDTVTATDHHPIWVNNAGEWVDAEDLKVGDYLLDDNGVTLLVDDIDIRQVSNQTVHNLTVDDLHTFFVLAGDDPILTHNNNCPIPRNADGTFARGAGGETAETVAGRSAHLNYENTLGGGD